MASVNKLSIRGIRAFSPEDREQVVEFFMPLTIIVGANGCGKTTIIEALKYAITGALPPGNKSGQAFVHDPKTIGQPQVKASVKLRFTTKGGQSMVVVRSMELTLKKTTASFKQLDGVIRTMDPNTGEKRSLSHKCGELDKQVPQFIGVSRAILEHVLFCHQEEASWPLMEGSVLKKRFDAIFDSTRYSKAIEVLRKKEKEYNSKVKDIKAELAGLTSHRHAAKGFRKELDEAHDIMEGIDEQKIQISRDLKEVEQTIEKYQAIIEKIELVDAKIKETQDARYRHKSIVDKQQEMLENDMTDSDVSDLKAQLQDFDQTMSAQAEEQQELQRQHSRLLSDIERLRKEEMKLSNDLTAHKMALQEQQRRQAKRYRIMEEICNTHSLDLQHFSQSQADQSFAASLTAGTTSLGLSQESAVTVSAEDMASFFEALGNKEQELQSKMDANKNRNKAADDEMQKAIQELSGKKQIIKNDLARLEKKKNDLQAEQSELLRKVSAHSRIRKGDVEETRKKAAEFAKKRDEANNDPRKTEIPTEIRQLEEKIDRLKRQIDEDRLTLKTLRLSADAQSSITLLEDQSKRDLEQLKEDVGENLSTFQKFNIPNVDISLDDDETGAKLVDDTVALVDAVRSKYETSHAELAKANEALAKTQKVISERNALMSNGQRTIQALKPKLEQVSSSVNKVKKLAQDLRRHESNLGLTCRLTEESPRELVSYLDTRLEELMEEAPVENSAKAVKKFIKKMKQMVVKSNECPCCKNTIDSQEAYQAFIDNLGALGNEVTKTDPQYEEAKSNYDVWKKVMSECIDDLRDHQRLSQEMREAELEHQSMVDDIGHFQGQLRNQKNDMDDLQRSDDELREFLDVAKRWSDDAGRIAQKRGEIGQKNIDLSASLIDTDRDLRTVERDLNRMMEEKDDMANKIASLNREMTQLNSAVTSFATQASRMEKVAREKEERFASERKNTERKAEIVELLQSISHEEKGLNDQLSPITKKISMKSSERERARALGEDEDRAMSGELSKFRTDVRALRSIAKEIDEFEEQQQEDDSSGVDAKVASVQKKISKRRQDVKDLQPHLEEMKKAVDDQERHKKQLIQNIEILESQKRTDELNKEIETLKAEKAEIEEVDDAYNLLYAAQEKQGVLKEKKYRTEGRFSEVAEQIRSLKRKLSAREYKDVEEECRVAQIKYETTQLAAGDLKKYAAAIDKALLQYHRVKIAEINKTIRELWLLTYKGEDITNIELVSGQDTSSRSNKSYNYRVVMTKGAGNKLDMRGRCSAGQRVLACIVIRLALAEAFGVSFGCLCLDEPTTNLDYRNKKGLALALCQIVAQRQQQRNFQLVCISHDLEFVSMMKTELSATAGISMPENFFQLRREEAVNGMYYSKIDAVEWDELGA